MEIQEQLAHLKALGYSKAKVEKELGWGNGIFYHFLKGTVEMSVRKKAELAQYYNERANGNIEIPLVIKSSLKELAKYCSSNRITPERLIEDHKRFIALIKKYA